MVVPLRLRLTPSTPSNPKNLIPKFLPHFYRNPTTLASYHFRTSIQPSCTLTWPPKTDCVPLCLFLGGLSSEVTKIDILVRHADLQRQRTGDSWRVLEGCPR